MSPPHQIFVLYWIIPTTQTCTNFLHINSNNNKQTKKPFFNPTSLANYHPITLISFVAKLLGPVLSWFLFPTLLIAPF